MKNDPAATMSHKSNWQTPDYQLAAVRAVFDGEISLDAASDPQANERVKAERYFSEGALERDWLDGNVFLNPPYGRIGGTSLAGRFLKKMELEFLLGHFRQGIALINSNTGDQWYQLVNHYPHCNTSYRTSFIDPDTHETGDSPRFGQTFVYFGDDWRKFADIFNLQGALHIPLTLYTQQDFIERKIETLSLIDDLHFIHLNRTRSPRLKTIYCLRQARSKLKIFVKAYSLYDAAQFAGKRFPEVSWNRIYPAHHSVYANDALKNSYEQIY